jgi:hypothetical protein
MMRGLDGGGKAAAGHEKEGEGGRKFHRCLKLSRLCKTLNP